MGETHGWYHSECWPPHTRGLQSLTNLTQVVVECFQSESTINHWGKEGVNIKSRRRGEEREDFHLSLTELHYSFLSPYNAVLALQGPNLLNAIYPKPKRVNIIISRPGNSFFLEKTWLHQNKNTQLSRTWHFMPPIASDNLVCFAFLHLKSKC